MTDTREKIAQIIDQQLKNKIVSAILSYPPDTMSKAEFMADQILAALALPSDVWRDISSMPDDGTPFLVEYEFSDKEAPEIVQVVHWSRDPEGSVVFQPFVGRGKSRPCIRFYPRRWRPIPQPPAQSEGGVDA